MSQTYITHNQWGMSPTGYAIGMLINVPGMVTNGINTNGQLVVRFYTPNGAPLYANQAEMTYRDIKGLCAAGTVVFPIVNNPANIGTAQMFIPYYALNLQPSGAMTRYELAVIATFYVNNFEKARSPLTMMWVNY